MMTLLMTKFGLIKSLKTIFGLQSCVSMIHCSLDQAWLPSPEVILQTARLHRTLMKEMHVTLAFEMQSNPRRKPPLELSTKDVRHGKSSLDNGPRSITLGINRYEIRPLEAGILEDNTQGGRIVQKKLIVGREAECSCNCEILGTTFRARASPSDIPANRKAVHLIYKPSIHCQ